MDGHGKFYMLYKTRGYKFNKFTGGRHMYVKLPEGRDYSGEEIVSAFKRAAVFETSLKKRYIARETGREMQYEAGSVRETIRRVGVEVLSQAKVKKWVLWGKMVWSATNLSGKNPRFILKPLLYQEWHRQVEVLISVGYYETLDSLGILHNARPRLIKFLDKFFEELKNPRSNTITIFPRAP